MFKKNTNSMACANNCHSMEAETIQKKRGWFKKPKELGNSNLINHNLLLLFILSINCALFQSCGNFVKDKGNVTIKNGKNENISIPYECVDCKKNVINKQIFTTIVNEIANSTINNLRYPLSFVPSNITLEIYPENNLKYYATKRSVGKAISVKSTIYYIAKNGFGNEIEGKNEDFFYLKNGSVDRELPKKIELTPLTLEKGLYSTTYINRKLFVSNEEYEFIQITPTIKAKKDGIYLIVESAFEDGGYGTTLVLESSYGERCYNSIVLKATKEFNDKNKSISYFNLTKKQIENLKYNKLISISIEKYPNSFYCNVDENLETYFNEYFSLKEVKKVLQKLK